MWKREKQHELIQHLLCNMGGFTSFRLSGLQPGLQWGSLCGNIKKYQRGCLYFWNYFCWKSISEKYYQTENWLLFSLL